MNSTVLIANRKTCTLFLFSRNIFRRKISTQLCTSEDATRFRKSLLGYPKRDRLFTSSNLLRFASTAVPVSDNVVKESLVNASKSTEAQSQIVDDIPEPPVPLPEVDVTQIAGADQTFESMGLGGWGPVGIIQNCFEFLHITCDLPWWGSIMIGTVVVRTLIFPLVIIAQRNAATMNNNLPKIQVLQMKMSDARERGDRLDTARHAQELMAFMNSKGINPFKNMLVPLCQAPLFISFFVGLRQMATVPIESMKTGGLFWFVDLTVPDQFYLLPIITSATLAITIEVGTDAARLNSANLGMLKYVFRAMPIVIFPFTINFCNAILVYWVSTNFISLIQVSLLRIPKVREFFKIEKLIIHDKETLPIKEKGFKKGFQDSWTNMKLSKELEERERVDQMAFMRAGRGAVPKTYKYDPTKVAPISAKKKDN